jgi:molecular chaperone DnaJ
MRITGEGEASPTGGPNGDLYVFLAVRPDRRFRREGQDLMCDVQVSFARAALGGAVRVATLEGDETLPIPDGTQPGDVFRLRGRGLPGLRRQERGDLHVMVRVATPTHLNDRQRKALEEFAAASGEDLGAAHPHGQNKGLIEWVRNLFTHKEEDETRERDGG